MLRLIFRLLGLSALVAGGLNLTEITRREQIILFIPKLIAGSVAPVMALAGGLVALAGALRRDRLALLTGLIGGALAVRHVARVTAQHDAFEAAFGDGWRAHLPPEMRERMLTGRYHLPFPEPPEVICLRDQVIGTTPQTGKPLLADLWKPPMWIPPSGLAVIYLHGSGWHYADKDFGTRLFFQHLAAQGHLILDLSYSLAPEANLPCALGDVKQAIAWLKTHGAAHQVNPARVVLVGASAGAHLALLAAYAPDHPAFQPPDLRDTDTSVRAVVSYYGPADVEFYYRYTFEHFGDVWSEQSLMSRLSGGFIAACLEAYEYYVHTPSRLRLAEIGLLSPADMLAEFLGGTPEDLPELYRLVSPVTHVGPHCPPTLLISGMHDIAMKPAMNHRLYQALRDAGVQAVSVELADTEHGLDLFAQRIAPAFHAATYDVERFLALML